MTWITDGALTITQSGSTIGDIDSTTPTDANTVAVGSNLSVTVGGTVTGPGGRGDNGFAAAYSVRQLGACIPAEVIDVPYLSAVVTVRRLRELERRYGLRTAGARARAWKVGVGGHGGLSKNGLQ